MDGCREGNGRDFRTMGGAEPDGVCQGRIESGGMSFPDEVLEINLPARETQQGRVGMCAGLGRNIAQPGCV